MTHATPLSELANESYWGRQSNQPKSFWQFFLKKIKPYTDHSHQKSVHISTNASHQLETNTPHLIHEAVWNDSFSTLQQLTALGANLNELDERGWSVLHYAAYDGNLKMVEWLLTHGAEVNIHNPDGDTPLHLAKENVIHPLLTHHADVNALNHDGGMPLLYHANAPEPIITLFLHHRANPFHTDKLGRTPLHFAGKESAKLLITEGADIKAMDKNGLTPLHYAIRDGRLDTAQLLIDAGAPLHALNSQGQRPVDMVRHQDYALLKQLLNSRNEA